MLVTTASAAPMGRLSGLAVSLCEDNSVTSSGGPPEFASEWSKFLRVSIV